MKLKHLFLTALVVGSLASCSKDDDGPNEPVYKQFDTNLSILATSNTNKLTKSSVASGDPEEGLDNEADINTLTAYVFYADGGEQKLAAKQTITSSDEGSIDRIEDIIVKVDATEAGQISKTSLKVVLLANVKLTKEPTTFSELENGLISGIDGYSVDGVKSGTTYLPMGSKVIVIPAEKLIAGTDYDNWITLESSDVKVTNVEQQAKDTDKQPIVGGSGDLEISKLQDQQKIALTRYVARIQLEGLDCNFAGNYEDATFTVKTVSIANASNTSKLLGEDLFALQNVLGQTNISGECDQTNAFFRGYPETIDRVDYYLAAGTQKNVLKKEYENGVVINNEHSVLFKGADNASEDAPEMARFYVFEFQNYAIGQDLNPKDGDKLGSSGTNEIYTTLIITGEWNNGPVKGVRNFRIPIKSTDSAGGVMRNNVYKVSATLTGEGTDNPDKNMLNACISFIVDVQPWKVIKQTEDDVN